MYCCSYTEGHDMDMTISQALRKISKLKGTLKEQLDRASSSVLFEETPAFPFMGSWEQAEAARAELIKLETALRITNAMTKFDFKGRPITLAEATCMLQEIKGKIAWLRLLPSQAQAERSVVNIEWDDTVTKQVKVMKKFTCELPEAKRADWVKREQDLFDALNDAVEAVNHRTPLVQG